MQVTRNLLHSTNGFLRSARVLVHYREKSIRQECLEHFIVFGESHLRHLVKQYVAHYNAERFHQGMDGRLLTQNADSANDNGTSGTIKTHSRLAGILNFYQRAAA